MRTSSVPQCCPLCDGMVDLALMPKHMRALHQVTPGEATIADVPVSTHGQQMAQASLECEKELLEAGAA